MLQFGITNHPPGANRKANKGGGGFETPTAQGMERAPAHALKLFYLFTI